jgi:hypothetical protein
VIANVLIRSVTLLIAGAGLILEPVAEWFQSRAAQASQDSEGYMPARLQPHTLEEFILVNTPTPSALMGSAYYACRFPESFGLRVKSTRVCAHSPGAFFASGLWSTGKTKRLTWRADVTERRCG